MRFIHTSDWHLGKCLNGISRMDEQKKFLNDFIDIVNENNIDMVIIAGDVFDSGNPSAAAEHLFYRTLKKLSDNGKRLIIVIAGNHDSSERLAAVNPLAKEDGIIIAGTPKSIVETGDYGENQVVKSGEGFIEIKIKEENVVVLLMPYPTEKRLNEFIFELNGKEADIAKSYGDKIKEIFDRNALNFRDDTINIVVAHLFTMGGKESESERCISLGGSYLIDIGCFPDKAQYIALGHLHKPQPVPGNKRVRYSGSPIHYSKDEISFDKKVFAVDINAGKEPQIEEIKLKVYKKIDVWKCDGIDEAIKMCREKGGEDSYVFIEITTDRYVRDDEVKTMKSLKADILQILPKIEKVDDTYETHDYQSMSFVDCFREFYKKEKGGVMPTKDIIDMLEEIMEECDDETDRTENQRAEQL